MDDKVRLKGMVVLNFSGYAVHHESCFPFIWDGTKIIEIPPNLNPAEMLQRIDKLLPDTDWRELYVKVALPDNVAVAAYVLAVISGAIGHFPAHLWRDSGGEWRTAPLERARLCGEAASDIYLASIPPPGRWVFPKEADSLQED